MQFVTIGIYLEEMTDEGKGSPEIWRVRETFPLPPPWVQNVKIMFTNCSVFGANIFTQEHFHRLGRRSSWAKEKSVTHNQIISWNLLWANLFTVAALVKLRPEGD